MRLYEISSEFAALWEQIQAVQDDMTLTAEECETKLSELEAQFRSMLQESTEKVEAAAKVVRMLDLEIKALDAEAERILSRQKSMTKNVDRLKSLMLYAVDAAFNGKVKTPLFSIWGQTSAETIKFEAVPDADLMKLPAEYVRISADLNRKALADAYKAGQPIPAEIMATAQPGTRYLRIK